jgi:serine/threonine protein kinase
MILTAILTQAPTPPVRLNPEFSPKLQEIINKPLEKDRDLRYQRAFDIRTDLKRPHKGCPYASLFGSNAHGGNGKPSPYGARPCGDRGPRDSFRPWRGSGDVGAITPYAVGYDLSPALRAGGTPQPARPPPDPT